MIKKLLRKKNYPGTDSIIRDGYLYGKKFATKNNGEVLMDLRW